MRSKANMLTVRDQKSTQELCSRCRAIDWHEPDENVFSSQVSRRELVRDSVSRQPCAFCRLAIHLLSPRNANGLVAEVAASGRRYSIANFRSKHMGKREVRIQVPKPNGLMATLGHIYGPILESGSTSYPAEDVELGASQVKSEMLLSWIGECEKEHNKCRDHAHAIGKFGAVPVKLIDVLEKKLVKAESRDRYIALSYMWGKAKMSQANQKNAPFLEAPGGLSAYLDQIPRTIRDAMHVVSMLGERFL